YRIDPDDPKVRRGLEERLFQAGRLRDVAKLLEQILATRTGLGDEGLAIRERLVALYTGELGDAERAMGHIEAVLRDDPDRESMRRAAHQMLEHRTLGVRASLALADAYERLGGAPNAAAMLAIAFEALRGP